VQEFGRIDQVVCKIDGEHRLGDLVQLWRRIIVSRALEGIEEVVSVVGFAASLQLIDEVYRGLAGRCLFSSFSADPVIIADNGMAALIQFFGGESFG
jgi:hypothetical protein